MIFSQPESAITILLKHLADSCTLSWQAASGTGKSVGRFCDGRAAVHVVIAPGEKAGP